MIDSSATLTNAMAATCVRQTDLPHTSRLFTDYACHFDRVSAWYAHAPMDASSYVKAADAIDLPDERRAALVAALREQNDGNPSLEKLAQPRTVAVVTGQQVGLFGGPAYTVYKALTAVALARHLTERGIAAVPVFWLATEDHDLAEVDHCWAFDEAHRPCVVRVDAAAATGQAVGGATVPAVPHEALQQALGGLPYRDEVLAQVGAAYPDGVTLGEGFLALLRQWLAADDLLFLDPMRPAFRRLAAPMLRRAVEATPELAEALLRRGRELQDAGYHAQVHFEKDTSLVFRLDGDRRVALRRQNGDYVGRDVTVTAEALADRAEQLSPNALLRPVVQDFMLPTVAYVGGPAELAYLAQSHVIYQRLLGRMPVMVPRNGFTLLDKRSAERMRKHHLTVGSFAHGEEAFREVYARHLLPSAVQDKFTAARTIVVRHLDGLRGEVMGFDPTLAAALDRSRAKMEYQLAKMERKVGRESLRRQERASAEADSLYGLVFPKKNLQERVYGMVPFLAKHGPDLIERIRAHVHLDCPDHVMLEV